MDVAILDSTHQKKEEFAPLNPRGYGPFLTRVSKEPKRTERTQFIKGELYD